MTTDTQPFNPRDHLTKLSRRAKNPDGTWKTILLDYLEVKWRLAWLRADHPDAAITTEAHAIDSVHAIFKATVTIPGGGSGCGWGSCVPETWKDYIEKAETKALGRALATVGYGIQFCDDFEEGDPVDSSVASPLPAKPAPPMPQQVVLQAKPPSATAQIDQDFDLFVATVQDAGSTVAQACMLLGIEARPRAVKAELAATSLAQLLERFDAVWLEANPPQEPEQGELVAAGRHDPVDDNTRGKR